MASNVNVSALPSVVTWWPLSHANARENSCAVEKDAVKGKAKLPREVEAVDIDPDGGASRRKSSRDRKEVALYDPVTSGTPTRLSPVQPSVDVKAKEADVKGPKRKRTAPLRLSPDLGSPAAVAMATTPVTPTANLKPPAKSQSTWPAAWKKLLDRAVLVPRDGLPEGAEQGLKEPSYVQQMRGARSRFYIGRPVRVLAEGKWEGGVLSEIQEVEDGKRRIMLSSGKEEDFETSDKAGRLRFDDRACGDFAVGRHAQVRFDGDQWFVGVVSTLQKNSHGDPHSAIMLFEDGDRVQVPVPDDGIELLPQEWSELVEKKRKWGWWGYNKDRIEVAPTKEMGGGGSAEVSKSRGRQEVAKKGAGRGGASAATVPLNKRRVVDQDVNEVVEAGGVGGGKRARGNASKETDLGAVAVAAIDSGKKEDVLTEEVTYLMEQMRGAATGFYEGCPVEVKEGWLFPLYNRRFSR